MGVPLFESELWISFRKAILSKYMSKDGKRYELWLEARTFKECSGRTQMRLEVRAHSKEDALRWGKLVSMFMFTLSEGYGWWDAFLAKE